MRKFLLKGSPEAPWCQNFHELRPNYEKILLLQGCHSTKKTKDKNSCLLIRVRFIESKKLRHWSLIYLHILHVTVIALGVEAVSRLIYACHFRI